MTLVDYIKAANLPAWPIYAHLQAARNFTRA
jgi:hypothetical protein